MKLLKMLADTAIRVLLNKPPKIYVSKDSCRKAKTAEQNKALRHNTDRRH